MKPAEFRAKWSSGIAAMAPILRGMLAGMDESGHPIERWGREEFDVLRKEVRQFFHGCREDMGAASVREKRQAAGLAVDPRLAAEAKAIRQHLKRIEPEALQFVERLARLTLNQKTRERTLMFVREWRAAHDRSGASPAQLAASLLDFLRQDHREVPSDNLTRQMLEKIERADFEVEGRDWPVAQGLAKRQAEVEAWTYELLPPDEADRREQFLPAPDIDQKLQRAMADYARSLGDRDSDLMILAMERFASRAKHPDDKVTIQINELMEALGYERHQGGAGAGAAYRAEDKAAVRERFEALQAGFLTIKKAGTVGGARGKIDVESKVLTIWDRAGQADLDGRVREWTAVTVGFGRAWSYRLFEPAGKLTAILQAKALQYHPQREQLEKRLLKRLGWFWKLNQHRAEARRSVLEWIRDDIGEAPEGYARSRDAVRLEDAFARLQKDGQIGGWRYADGHPRIGDLAGELPRGWRDRWLEREIVVEAPQSLQLAYAERRGAPLPVATPAQAEPVGSLGARFRSCRVAHGISALQAAADLGIDNTVLSRIETGKRQPSETHRQAMLAWMAARKS